MSKPFSTPSRPVLQQLAKSLDEADHGTVQTPELRAALDALRTTRIPATDVERFWDAAGWEHVTGRTQNLRAAMNRIRWHMGLAAV